MGIALRGMGFEVIEVRDAGKQRMEEAIALSRAMLQGRSGVGLLYYAGHGLQVDWRNYMVPVDAEMTSAMDVPKAAVDIQGAIDAFRAAGNRVNIVVLDACRDNPFGSASTGKGLAPLDAPPGTYLAYATAPGNFAEEGNSADGNGLYTRFLLKELKQPQSKIEDVFKRVRLQVRQASKGRQVPWDSSSLEEDFVFSTGQAVAAESARQLESAFSAQKADWDRIKDADSSDALFAFLAKYPNGVLSELAQFRLDQLAKVLVVPMAGRDRPTQLPSGVRRYSVGDTFEWEGTDRLTGTQRRYVWQVTEATDTRVTMGRGVPVFDQMGGLLEDRFGRKDPALVQVPTDLSVGKRWRSAFRSIPHEGPWESASADFKVVGLEALSLPSGQFTAYQIEWSGSSRGPRSTTVWTGRAWVDPSTMMVVKQEDRHRIGGELTFDHTRLLIRMSRSPRN